MMRMMNKPRRSAKTSTLSMVKTHMYVAAHESHSMVLLMPSCKENRCYSGVIMVSQRCYNGFTTVLQWRQNLRKEVKIVCKRRTLLDRYIDRRKLAC
jgi:hypothetical protein